MSVLAVFISGAFFAGRWPRRFYARELLVRIWPFEMHVAYVHDVHPVFGSLNRAARVGGFIPRWIAPWPRREDQEEAHG